MEGEWVIEVGGDEEDCVRSLREELDDACRKAWRLGSTRTIYRIPDRIMRADPESSQPKIVSLGPYHRGKPRLQAVEGLKRRYLDRILRRNKDCDVRLEDYIEAIKNLEVRARSCYSEDIDDVGSDDFVKMMVLDGCFILELLRYESDGFIKGEEIDGDWNIISGGESWTQVGKDMMLLENQVPFFVLETLFDLVINPNSNYPHSLVDLTHNFFWFLTSKFKARRPTAPTFHHFLHLFHSCVVPAKQERRPHLSMSRVGSGSESGSGLPIETIPCAKELKEAGVKFRRRNEALEQGSFFDFEFNSAIITMTHFNIIASTTTAICNLLAFEQCYGKVGNHFSAYATVMDCMINTPEDVALLQRHGVIVNNLGSHEEAAVFFNNLGNGTYIDFNKMYLKDFFRDVNQHCNSITNKWRAKLKRYYFSTPWAIFSLLGALVLLFLTVIQTLFGILSYYRRGSN